MNKSTRRELDKIAMTLPLSREYAERSADILLRSAPSAKLAAEIAAVLAVLGLPTVARFL